MIELVFEGDAVVHGLHQPARCRRDPVGGRIGLEDGERGDASRHVGRADRAPGQRLDPFVRNRSFRRRQRRRVVAGLQLLKLLVQGLDLFFQFRNFLWLVALCRTAGRNEPEAQTQANGQRQTGGESAKTGMIARHQNRPSLQRTKVANPWGWVELQDAEAASCRLSQGLV